MNLENFDNIENFVDLLNLRNLVGESKIQSLDNFRSQYNNWGDFAILVHNSK